MKKYIEMQKYKQTNVLRKLTLSLFNFIYISKNHLVKVFEQILFPIFHNPLFDDTSFTCKEVLSATDFLSLRSKCIMWSLTKYPPP